MPTRFVFDIEADGFLEEVTRLWVLVIRNADTSEVVGVWNPQSGFDEGLRVLKEADLLIGHNVIKYDLAVLDKLYGFTVEPSKVYDTLVGARLAYPDVAQRDMKDRDLPKDCFKRHSLKAWGHRLGNAKAEYEGGFDEWSQEMEDYCVQDTSTNVDLFKHIEPILSDMPDALALEFDVQRLMHQVELNGWPFDFNKAIALQGRLSDEREKVRQELVGVFGTWAKPVPSETVKDDAGKVLRVDYAFDPKTSNKTRGVTKGNPFCKIEWETFNPASRHHIARCLKERHGWEPQVFTDGGQPKIDDDILEALEYPEARLIGRYLMLEKRLSQLAEGDRSWLNYYKPETGKIYPSYSTIGTNTTRMAAHGPNIQQVPANDKPFGPECRSLFHVPKGWFGCGTDMAALEARVLGHYLSHFDGGAYAKVLLTADVHWFNAQAFGFIAQGTTRDKHNQLHETSRQRAKLLLYQMLYGAGPELLGTVVGGGTADGARLKKMFFTNIPAISKLEGACKAASKRGYIKAIDGVKLPTRSEHSALNLLLQGTGARICKAWLHGIDVDLTKIHGLKHGWDGDYVILGACHDEAQTAGRSPEIATLIGETSLKVARGLTSKFSFKCDLDADYTLGQDWSATH